MKSIITELPLAFSLLCLLLGALYAGVLYFREYKHEFPAKHRAWLAAVRFVLVSVISFFLLSPLVRSLLREVEEPIVIIAQDNSSSLENSQGIQQDNQAYLAELAGFAAGLDDNFNVHQYTFGSQVKRIDNIDSGLPFDEERTDISRLFKDLGDIYENRNVGAVIVASDGLYNSGINPLYGLNALQFPVYTVGLGDTSIRKDVLIADVRYNRMAYLKNTFPVEVTVLGNKASGETSRIEIYNEGSRIAYRDITFSGEAYSEKVVFMLEANEAGLIRYDIKLREIENEINTSNNSESIFIEVLDSRNRILIIAAAPHPDITAMKEALRSNINYEVEDVLLSDLDKNLEAYNLVILHQVPSNTNLAADLTKELKEKSIPTLYFLGPQSAIPMWNGLDLGVEIQADKNNFQEVLPDVNKNFSLFTLPEEMVRMIGAFPPLTAPFGKYQRANNIVPFIDQRIGNITTSRPLVAFGKDIDRRWGIFTGTGIWRWRLMNYANTGSHDSFNELVMKIVQYLSLRENKRQFRVFHERSFFDNETVVFEAEVYNESYELINTPEVDITIVNDEGDKFPFSFIRMGQGYYLEAGTFPQGKYEYTSRVNLGDTTYTSVGAFTVTELDIESLRTTADHNLLFNIAAQTGGKSYTPGQLTELSNELSEKPEIKPVVFSHLRYLPLMDFPWILAGLIALLTIEWFARRRLGSY